MSDGETKEGNSGRQEEAETHGAPRWRPPTQGRAEITLAGRIALAETEPDPSRKLARRLQGAEAEEGKTAVQVRPARR